MLSDRDQLRLPEDDEDDGGVFLRILQGIFVAVFLVLFVAVVGTYVLLQRDGKVYAERALGTFLGYPVTFSDMTMTFPSAVRLDGVKAAGHWTARAVEAEFDFPFLQDGKLQILKLRLIEPALDHPRADDAEPAPVVTKVEPEGSWTPAAPEAAGRWDRVTAYLSDKIESADIVQGIDIRQLRVENGRLDESAGLGRGIPGLALRNINLKADDVVLPRLDENSSFVINATVESDEPLLDGRVVMLQGSLDWAGRNMEAALRLPSAASAMDVRADLSSVNNEVTVTGRIKLDGARLSPAEAASPALPQAGMIKSAMKNAQLALDTDFEFQTRLDRFKIEKVSLSGSIGYDEVAFAEPLVAPAPAEGAFEAGSAGSGSMTPETESPSWTPVQK